MLSISTCIDQLTTKIGKFTNGVILLMVVVTAGVALLRYLFDVGWIWLQESVTYFHGLFFLGALSLGLLKEGHVRVDIFYRSGSPKFQAKVDLFGTVFLLIPFCVLVLSQSFGYVISSWVIFEGSRETGGIPGVFLLKSLIILFAANLLLQGVSQILKSWNTLRTREA